MFKKLPRFPKKKEVKMMIRKANVEIGHTKSMKIGY